MKGWVKLHRRIMQSETFSKLNAIQQLVAIYIILNANHDNGVWYDKYKDIEVPVRRGQLVTSRNKMINEWFKGDKMITDQKIRTTLKKLEKLNFITIEPTNSYTLIEVLNYNVYQMNGNESNQEDNQETTKSQPANNQVLTTNKNVKNEKNVKKKYKDYVSMTTEEYKKLIEQFGENGTDERMENLNLYKGSKGKKYKSDYMTILAWERKNKSSSKKQVDWEGL